ncbi:MAG: Ribonucleoside-diphosphate reductase, partial [Candidatus Daviesbacteria bacterium GW2011_GWA2_42_7]
QFGVIKTEESAAETIPLNLTIIDHQENGWGGENMTLASQDNSGPVKMADLCPECGNATFVFEEGCKKCHSCGYSAC